ncbi:Mitochondrial metalloendopeptidase OMA1 [Tetrabaena socialis]|uniref:Mitochondrial metalloendopeptidase OMA1 n=1 Tax=Tetrabaena socialis TaxID=47790 RepID=A0A2J8AG83_9CHLO|nr:Mitochondrial metalloendopeptidase OMA1 [Tetrabaena socialis]|eukprot:PNH11538.1 Mitochondrial metalloendopeptidase OMA1 [Tetrabaena socialis]
MARASASLLAAVRLQLAALRGGGSEQYGSGATARRQQQLGCSGGAAKAGGRPRACRLPAWGAAARSAWAARERPAGWRASAACSGGGGGGGARRRRLRVSLPMAGSQQQAELRVRHAASLAPMAFGYQHFEGRGRAWVFSSRRAMYATAAAVGGVLSYYVYCIETVPYTGRRHSIMLVSPANERWMGQMVFNETEADRIGLRLMARACFDPAAAPAMLAKLNAVEKQGRGAAAQIPAFLRTHPLTEARVAMVEQELKEAYRLYGEAGCAAKRGAFSRGLAPVEGAWGPGWPGEAGGGGFRLG